MEAYFGDLVYSVTKDELVLKENSYVIVNEGKVVEVLEQLKDEYKDILVHDYKGKMIIPGFSDLHFHAPQFENIGLGLEEELIPWLNKYTFVEERKFSDIEYAEKVYKRVINEIWKQGTTRIVFFATLHSEASGLLIELLDKSGLGGYVGKVNMDRNSPDYLVEETTKSFEDTVAFMEKYNGKFSKVAPIITPRFVPTCTKELMENLGKYAQDNNLPIQTHLNENRNEIAWVNELHPECDGYLDVYDKTQLLNDKTIFAHCIYNTDKEVEVLSRNKCFAAHSPSSNLNLSSGIMPIRKLLNAGVRIGLGTDVGAGHNTSIKDEMLVAMHISKSRSFFDEKNIPLTINEAFFLATKGGGEYFGKVGSFEEGYEFDALIIDDSDITLEGTRNLFERFEKYVYHGDDRNISERFVRGEKINKPF